MDERIPATELFNLIVEQLTRRALKIASPGLTNTEREKLIIIHNLLLSGKPLTTEEVNWIQ